MKDHRFLTHVTDMSIGLRGGAIRPAIDPDSKTYSASASLTIFEKCDRGKVPESVADADRATDCVAINAKNVLVGARSPRIFPGELHHAHRVEKSLERARPPRVGKSKTDAETMEGKLSHARFPRRPSVVTLYFT